MSKRSSKMWEYLESTGVLEKGTEEEIRFAKKRYQKEYILKYRQQQRLHKPEFTVNFSNEKGELGRIQGEAKKHNMTVTRFIKQSVLAYMEQTFLVPNPDQIAYLEHILSECLNQVKLLVKPKERYGWEVDRKLEEIEKKIADTEAKINSLFRHPPVQKNDSQNQII